MNTDNRSRKGIRYTMSMLAALLKSIPAFATIIFILTIITMNFLSRISILSLPWLALNAGITISWLSFLYLDIITKHYGAKSANMMSILAIGVNLLMCLICFLLSRLVNIPGLDFILDGQWSILTASTIAFLVSALSNNYTNIFIGKKFKEDPDSKKAYAARSFISTFLSQILDNFIFVFLAFWVFPNIPGAFPVRWTLLQCIGCSVTCAFIELLSEVIFSPLGYYVSRKWKEKSIGREYIETYCPEGVI